MFIKKKGHFRKTYISGFSNFCIQIGKCIETVFKNDVFLSNLIASNQHILYVFEYKLHKL